MSRNNRPSKKVETVAETKTPDEKLQKVLARIGLGSRREMERAIVDGRVTVNGKVATLGDRVKSKDRVEFDGRPIASIVSKEQRLRVILYNKAEGEICSRSDPEGRPTVYRNLPRLPSGRWISVGRLDFNTTGLLLFTNDGDLANKLMHPSSSIDREYLVRVQGEVDDEMLKRLREGVLLEDGVAKFTDIKEIPSEGSNQWFYCVVMEGRNREVRRLWESQELRVSRLKRVRYGNIFIPSYVRMGQWVELNDKEVAELCLTAGIEPPEPQKFSEVAHNARERHLRRLRTPGAANSLFKERSKPEKIEGKQEKVNEHSNKNKTKSPPKNIVAPWERKGGKRPKPQKRK